MSAKGKVEKLDFSEEMLLSSAERRFHAGDYLGALTMLNRRNERYEPTADSSVLAADIYEALKLYPQAAAAWFRFLDTCNEADFAEGYEGLAITFMNMGNEPQSALYYHRMLAEDGGVTDAERNELMKMFFQETKKPRLRLVYTAEGGDDCSDYLSRGLIALKTGNLKVAREQLAQVTKQSKEYPSAVGLSAMCALMSGDSETAERECLELLQDYPNDVQALTTYCAVLSEREEREKAQEVARRLYAVPTDSEDDLYKIATALCETGLHEEAYQTLQRLIKKNANDRGYLWFLSVAAYKTNRLEEAVKLLERLTTLYPYAKVAEYYLIAIRKQLDGEGAPEITYFYRLPDDEHEVVLGVLSVINDELDEALPGEYELNGSLDVFYTAFDENEGQDEKLQTIAADIAVRCRAESFIRHILLDYELNDIIKFYILHELTVRNEDNSFGTVICGLYKEFFIHKINIGKKKYLQFLDAYADVYSKFALLSEENEAKILNAAEEVYRVLAEQDAYDCMDEREALAAVIYRESHLRRSEHGIDRIAELFTANKQTVLDILDKII